MKIIVYGIAPIDWWNGWTREAEFLRQLSPHDENRYIIEEYVAFTTAAFSMARQIHWEGDISNGPYVSALPNPEGSTSEWLVAWKQSNNGTTFIASRYRLPWLHDDTYAGWIEDQGNGVLLLSPWLHKLGASRK